MNQQQSLVIQQGSSSKDARRARTRTLIQLGGLVEKAGLLNLLKLELGQDLQRDFETVEATATLMGSLLFLTEFFQSKEANVHKMLWCVRGKEALRDPRQPQPMPVTT